MNTLIIYQQKDSYDSRYVPEYQCPKCGSWNVFWIKAGNFETKHVCRDCWHKDWTDNFVKPE